MSKQQVSILGATGSIGESTLKVVDAHRDQFAMFALTANRQYDKLFDLCLDWEPKYAVLRDQAAAAKLEKKISAAALSTQVLSGEQGLCQIAQDQQVDIVVAAIVGAAGLSSCMAAAQAGKKILLANKEALVMAGELFMQAVTASCATLLPIDSEHNAIFQCLPDDYQCGHSLPDVQRIILTASGGPFLHRALDTFDEISVAEACLHPNWSMGKKISVDSATMMNKGLELIEACHLFACDSNKIKVIVHPQSIIHSMVEYLDGSVLAQMGPPDMRTPIAHALAWPQRIQSGVSSLDFYHCSTLSFEKIDFQRFPALKLTIQAIQQGQAACIVLNAANEIAVDKFLQGQIKFTDIARLIEMVLEKVSAGEPMSIDDVKALDKQTRLVSQELMKQLL